MKKDNKKNITNKDLDKFVAQEIKDVSKEKERSLFTNQNIAISISDSPETDTLGFSFEHQKNLIIEITRALIIHGSTLIYGGDLRNNGYTRLFSELVYQYRPSDEVGELFFKNFFSFPIYLNLEESDLLDFKKNGVQPIKISPPDSLKIDQSNFYPPNTKENLFIWAESLTKMREEMQSNTDARIFTGGSMSNFKGKYPGLLEESILALKENIPVYFIGIFGGISSRIIEAIKGKIPQELTLEWQSSQNENYKDFVNHYNSIKSEQKIDYKKSVEFLNEYTLEKLSTNNGLSIEENNRLFSSIHTSEIIFLIMKGLSNKLKK
ncbi:hypothetical protein ABHQ57_10965 [Tenacibaculum sp. ZH5_bin.1]|uniref:hypothetical protein n=1 Tax=Tenacibaculum TaxID=104267 RepID=UPI00142FC2DF|nr:hypothetical protein [Tenacibaculum mesophilum]KAF9658506.1 hypothetical protein HBA12_15135 [Tenacibaculum mesophilum]